MPETIEASKLKIGRPVPDTDAMVTLADLNMSANATKRHPRVVEDDQEVVRHAPASPPPPCSTPAVAVWSPTPKFSPEMVNDAYPLCGAFSRTSDADAASKVKIGDPVPDTDATVTLAALNKSANAFDRHVKVVADVQDEVRQTPRSPPPPLSSPNVAVCSPIPKCRPDTVTDANPLCGAFRRASETTAASKLKTGLPVPETEATVTLAALNKSPTAFERQVTDVAVLHDDVKQSPLSPVPPRSSPNVAVGSPSAKLRPLRVSDAYPL